MTSDRSGEARDGQAAGVAATPGPWEVVGRQIRAGAGLLDYRGRVVVARVCDSDLSGIDCPQPDAADANGRLLAAAPDLFDALVRINALIAAWRVTGKPELALIASAQEQADAAIARATGEAA